jgi:hypothetical protein
VWGPLGEDKIRKVCQGTLYFPCPRLVVRDWDLADAVYNFIFESVLVFGNRDFM